MFSMKQRFSLLGSAACRSSGASSVASSLANSASCGSPSSLRGYSSTSQLHSMCYSCASKHMQQEKKKKAKLLPFVHQNQLLVGNGSTKGSAPSMRRHFSTSKVSRFSAAAYDPYTIEEYVKGKVTHSLDAIFKPKSVALIGASEKQGSVGRTILWNLMSTPFGGTIYPVNPKRKNVMGIRAFESVKAIPEGVDLAVICIPAPQVPQAIRECVEAKVKGAIVISAGFSEAGEQGQAWCKEMVEIANAGGMRIIGPNCLGVMNPLTGLNATFAANMAEPGKIAVISQSGALATAILDFSLREHVGFSAFMSIGSMADVQWGDLLEFLGRDPKTEAILLYMESIGDARSFINAARTVALTKPIIVIKVGKTEMGGKAAASHTGSLVGSDDVLDAAFKRAGVLRVDTIQELFYMAQTLAKQPRPKGNRLCILTNAGGPAALSVDALCAGKGELAEVSPATMDTLNKFLPEHWSHNNPVDILGDAPPERYLQALDVVSQDANNDAILLILTPQAMSEPTRTAQVLKDYQSKEKKPVLASWMGGSIVKEGRQVLASAGIPVFAFPDVAVKVFNYMWQYSKNLENLYDLADLQDLNREVPHANREAAKKLLQDARDSGRTLLTEFESKQLLGLYGIKTTQMRLANTADEAVAAASAIGYPVVLKLHSLTITHKTEVGGVALNLKNEQDVREAFASIKAGIPNAEADFHGVSVQEMVTMKDSYEVMFGSATDSQVGKTVVFGHGGTLVEVYKDTVIGLPPLTINLARNMIKSTRIYHALKGFRGKPAVNLEVLAYKLLRFSLLVTELNTFIEELDVNPLLVSANDIVALDCRVVLYPKHVQPHQVPSLAVREYPLQHVQNYSLQGSEAVCIRPVRFEDHKALALFFEAMSADLMQQSTMHDNTLAKLLKPFSNAYQSMKSDKSLAADVTLLQESKEMYDMLLRLCIGVYDREMVFIAESDQTVLGIGVMSKANNNYTTADVSILVSDELQNKNLGSILLEHIVKAARSEGVEMLTARIAKNAEVLQRTCHKAGFDLITTVKGDVIARLPLVKKE